MYKVYLAGYINDNKLQECVAWRKRVVEHYNNWKGQQKYPITWLDPLNGKDLNSIIDEGLKSSIPDRALLHRDYKCVLEADLIVVNMNTFGADRPLIGTICELAWAWEHHKPIIMITEDKRYSEHCFTGYFVSWIVKDVDELLEKKCINYFYKGAVDALY